MNAPITAATTSALCTVACTLRHNVDLASDVGLARRELQVLTGAVDVRELRTLGEWRESQFTHLPRPLRARMEATRRGKAPFGFVADVPSESVARLVMRSGFLQDVVAPPEAFQSLPRALFHVHAPDLASAVPVAALAEYASRLIDTPTINATARLDALLAYLLRGAEGAHAAEVRAAVASKKTTLALSHDLHIYKAKFFPRMVRALLNTYASDHAGETVVDPFCGSGTALLEASMLGHPSVGLDVDPLSTLISDCKVRPFTTDRTASRELLARLHDEINDELRLLRPRTRGGSRSVRLPAELRGKLARQDDRNDTAYLAEIEEDLGLLVAVRERHEHGARGLLDVMVSDALTKKIRYRFVGVGNGRYTIEVVHQRLWDRFREKVASTLALLDVFEWLEHRCGVRPAASTAVQGDATTLDGLPRGTSFGVCVTSPPYLPASSGREHYAPSRALALAVTGLESAWRGDQFLGAREVARHELDPRVLPPAGRRLMEYLMSDTDRADPQRDAMRFERKAVPTWRYLRDTEAFLTAMRGRIAPSGVCLMVVAAQHTFYSHRRHQAAKLQDDGGDEAASIEYVVDCAEMYGEIARRAGWSVEDGVRLDLAKPATSVARPRASDEYAEHVLVLR